MRAFADWIKKYSKNMKFRKKLVVSYFIVSIVPILILGLFCYRQTRDLLREREISNLNESLYQMNAGLENQVHIYNNLTDYIAFNQTISQVLNYDYKNYFEMREMFTTLLDPLLTSLQYFHNEVSLMTIYSANDIVEHGQAVRPISEIADSAWYEESMADTEIHWFIDRDGKSFMTRRIPEMSLNSRKGMLYLEIDYQYLFDSLNHAAGQDYGVFILDREGREIFHQEYFTEENKKYALDGAGRASLPASYAVESVAVDGCGWDFYIYKPDVLMTRSAVQIAVTVAAVAAACLVIIFLMGNMVSRLVVYRLEKLRNKMKQVETGDLSVAVERDGEDEVGDLIGSFGSMIDRIRVLIKEVYESKLAQKEYEMKALQAQINPHFLYNTMSLINWKALAAGEKDISKLTLLISAFYRTALNKGKNTIPVKDEIKNIESYIEIQRVMHDDSFDVVIETEPGMMEYEMPNLTLQPIVENAINHGIDLKEDGRGVLTVKGYLDKGELVFAVSDNGIGMEEEVRENLLTVHTKGYGMRNVNERIILKYGEEYALKVESTVGKGTKITVRIPVKEGEI